MMKSLTISSGAFANYTATRDDLLRRARDVFAALREGWLKLRVDRTFPLAQAAEARRLRRVEILGDPPQHRAGLKKAYSGCSKSKAFVRRNGTAPESFMLTCWLCRSLP
jgi:hypothetical protein